MNSYSMIKKLLLVVLYSLCFFIFDIYGFEKLDVMVDFAYPLSTIESVRYALSQALFSLQQGQENITIFFLEQALSLLDGEKKMTYDDIAFLQNMLEQITYYIDRYEEHQSKVVLLELSATILNNL